MGLINKVQAQMKGVMVGGEGKYKAGGGESGQVFVQVNCPCYK